MKVKTSELTGAALDWAVAKCEGHETEFAKLRSDLIYVLVWKCCPLTGDKEVQHTFEPSTCWSQGGPIIERRGIAVMRIANRLPHQQWEAGEEGETETEFWGIVCGPTPLIAAMRFYVIDELGDEVDIPEELT
jgi:hypothetical protein